MRNRSGRHSHAVAFDGVEAKKSRPQTSRESAERRSRLLTALKSLSIRRKTNSNVPSFGTAENQACAVMTDGIYRHGMSTAKIFQSGRSQAVRLPKEFRFGGTEVYVARMGSAVVLMPPHRTWDVLFEACEGVSKDFMKGREQPPTQLRDL